MKTGGPHGPSPPRAPKQPPTSARSNATVAVNRRTGLRLHGSGSVLRPQAEWLRVLFLRGGGLTSDPLHGKGGGGGAAPATGPPDPADGVAKAGTPVDLVVEGLKRRQREVQRRRRRLQKEKRWRRLQKEQRRRQPAGGAAVLVAENGGGGSNRSGSDERFGAGRRIVTVQP